LNITIEDTGLGIQENDRHNLFQKFGYIENDQGMNKDGIGLGLVILDSIVQQFNGKIEFKPTKDGGSTFFFSFQLESNIEHKNITYLAP
jgi:K+-sensing histidine kinase KdpD